MTATAATTPLATPRLGFWALLGLGLNGVVGVGIFFTPREVAAAISGGAGLWAFVLTALALLPVAVVFGVLGARVPADGGPYQWARLAFGELPAFAVGWLGWVSALFSAAAVLAGLARQLGPWLDGVDRPWLAVPVAVLLAALVATGLRPAAALWSALAVAKVVPLVLIGALGLAALTMGRTLPPSPSVVEPQAVLRGSLVVLFALQGFEVVPVLAGRARSASSVALATLLTLVICSLLYLSLHAACLLAVPDLAHASAPVVQAATGLGGALLGRLLGAVVLVSALGISFGMAAVTPVYLASLGAPAGLGSWLGAVDARGVPARALALTTVVEIALLLLGDLRQLFALSSIAVLAQYVVATLSLAALALRRRHGFGPLALLPVPFALAAVLAVAVGARLEELAVAAAFVCAGLVLRWFIRSRLPRTE